MLRIWLRERCLSALGMAWVDAMSFSSSYEVVKSQLAGTAEMLGIIRSDDDFPLDGVLDISQILSSVRVEGTFISAPDLVDVLRTLGTITALNSYFNSKRDIDGVSSIPELDLISQGLGTYPEVIKMIEKIIDRFGEVRDNASSQLRDIRARISSTSGAIASVMRRVMASAVESGYIEADVTPSVRDGRLVIPVAPMNKRRIHGIVHDESASGKTVYIEPAEIVEANNKIRELQMEERREITRILVSLTAEIRPKIDDILASLDVVGHIDFIMAKARMADDMGGILPQLSDKEELEWYHALHPVLLASLRKQGKEIVPLDITLSPEARLLVISGPNAGGKSVCLKTVSIVQYMTQCGMLPPVYENSHMGIFSDIFLDIGDDQSIENDLSTYSSHLRNMKYFLQYGSNSTLVLIDEFGGGTEPQIGGAIAQAVLHRFNDKGMWGVITTHYQNLKHFAEDTDGLINGSMLYDRHLMQPLFKLSIGNPGSSFAVEIARKIGLPEQIINEAQDIVGSDYINIDRYLLDIARDKRYWENKRMSIRQKEKKIETRLAQYEEDAELLRQKRREIIEDARKEARRILDDSNASIERTIHDIRKAQAEKESTKEARKKLDADKKALLDGEVKESGILRKAPKRKNSVPKNSEQLNSEPIKIGDNVLLDDQPTVGRVLDIEGKAAIVAFGMMNTKVKIDRLRRTVAKIATGSKAGASLVGSTSDAQRERQLNFKQELDIRGMRVDEAIQAVTYYIDDAIRFSEKRVRILHGTGTGALRQAIRQYLDTVPGVVSYHDEHVQFGGAGITIVNL